MKSEIEISIYGPCSQGYSSWVRKPKEGPENDQSCDANFDHVDSPNGFTSSFIHSTRMERLSSPERTGYHV